MTNQLTNSNAFTKTDLAGAVANAENGGLSLLGYSNPNGHGHVATFSVGDNLAKGEVANIGSSNGFMNAAPGNGKSVFGKATIGSVNYFTLKDLVPVSTGALDVPKGLFIQPGVSGNFMMKLYRWTKGRSN